MRGSIVQLKSRTKTANSGRSSRNMKLQAGTRFTIYVGVITIGGGFLALGQLSGFPVLDLELGKLNLSESFFYLGVLLVALASVALVLDVVACLYGVITGRLDDGHRGRIYSCEPASMRHLDKMLSFLRDFLNEVPSERLVRDWHKRNPRLFWLVYEISHASIWKEEKRLVGVFKVVPLTTAAIDKLSREVVGGTTFLTDDIAESFESAAGLYIGDLVATKLRARGITLAYLEEKTRTARDSGVPLFARPLTPTGLRLCRLHGFFPVSPLDQETEIGRIHRHGDSRDHRN